MTPRFRLTMWRPASCERRRRLQVYVEYGVPGIVGAFHEGANRGHPRDSVSGSMGLPRVTLS